METCGLNLNCELEIFGQIGEQFNNPDLSDVTLKVGEQSYHVHRFVLAAQSSVFKSMLVDDRWKESSEKVIQLQESQEGEASFCEFLKFFYTGKLTYFGNNVCGLHMLADKYDIPLVKARAEAFMQEVLSGVRGEALPSALKWLAYIEQFIPQLLQTCYEAVQTNFLGLTLGNKNYDIEVLAPRHLKEILMCGTSDKDLAVFYEKTVYSTLEEWAKSKFNNLSCKKAKSELKIILPLIRFHNMTGEDLQEVEESELCKAMGKSFVCDYISPAYKVHSQRLSMVASCKQQKLSRSGDVEYKCPCEATDVCPHLNPRFYYVNMYPFTISQWVKAPSQGNVKPLDLGSLETCVKIYTDDQRADKGSWTVSWKENASADGHINETFTVKPEPADIGRKFTLAVVVVGPKQHPCYRYTVKHTNVVARGQSHAEPILIHSPLRPKTSWHLPSRMDDDDEKFFLGVAIHLHKP